MFATGVNTGALTTVRLADNRVQSLPVAGASSLCDVQISSDGRLVCVACSDAGTAAVIDPVANVVRQIWDDSWRSGSDGFDQTNAVGFKPDGQTIGILGGDFHRSMSASEAQVIMVPDTPSWWPPASSAETATYRTRARRVWQFRSRSLAQL